MPSDEPVEPTRPSMPSFSAVAKLHIGHPDPLTAIGPDDETRVACPACAKGMVSPKLAAKVQAALRASEPEAKPIPRIITQTMHRVDTAETDPRHKPKE